MARSFSRSLALVADIISPALSRWSHAAAVGSRGLGISGGMGKAVKEEMTRKAGVQKSWVPDPVTGYYRPGNTEAVDVAELRATLLKNKKH